MHPDRVGGNSGDQQRLNDAYGSWQDLLRKAPGSGKFSNGGSQESPSTLAVAKGRAKGYEIRSEGVLLTYQGFRDVAQWDRFVPFVVSRVKGWRVKYWTATMETNADGTYHTHLMLQFFKAQDRTVVKFIFEGLRPNARTNDYLGEGQCRKKLQEICS